MGAALPPNTGFNFKTPEAGFWAIKTAPGLKVSPPKVGFNAATGRAT
jgi:hypothetical protein